MRSNKKSVGGVCDADCGIHSENGVEHVIGVADASYDHGLSRGWRRSGASCVVHYKIPEPPTPWGTIPMLRPALPLFATLAAILLPAAESFAQMGRSSGSSLGGGSSAFAGSSFGGSGFGSSSFGQSGFGGSSFGQSGFGQSGFGQSGFGQSGFGQSSFGSGAQTSAFGAQGGNQAFIGRGAADMTNFFGGAANQGAQTTQRQQRAGGNRSNSDSASNTPPEVRVAITPSQELQRFVATNRAPAEAVVSNVSRSLSRKGVSGVNVTTVDGVTTLEGVVTSASDKLLAEKLASIEPGVRRVDNRLVIEAEPEEVYPQPQ